MIVKLLTEHHLEFLCITGGCRGSPESSHVKIPHCWKLHVTAQNFLDGEVPRYLVHTCIHVFLSLFLSQDCVLMLMTQTTASRVTKTIRHFIKHY